jgi:hypothetical protein
MKILAIVALATLVATPALAQGAAYHGSGQRAGGPANELNTGGLGRVSAQGTVYDPSRTVPFRSSASGQRAGGSYQR